METVYTIAALRSTLREVRAAGRRVAFVPTMGHLHGGHQALVRRAHELADYVVASIFVNPIQFGEGEDYSSYPRTAEADAQKLIAVDTHLLFSPDVGELYPHGYAEGRMTRVEVPELSDILEGLHRPGHFRGVSTVVSLLFNLVQPDVAVFGEKDYQQLVVIRRMVRDLHIPVEVAAASTTRAPDGLALSSRNSYLSAEERGRAPALYRTLCAAREAILRGARDYPGLEAESMQALGAAGFRPEYVTVRDARDLSMPGPDAGELVVLAAAWLGRARLIDNVKVRSGLPT